MASPQIEQLQARITALPNHVEGVDIVKALSDIADALNNLDDKIEAAVGSIVAIEEEQPAQARR
jgi:hypothetical protein